MDVTIKKATIRGSLFLNYEFDQTEVGVKNSIKTSSDQAIHDDLRNAFRAFIPHFCFICEEIRDEKLIKKAVQDPMAYLGDKESAPDTSFFKYKVFDFKVNEKKDGDIILTLTGSKQLESGDEISFGTPEISMLDDDYKFFDELNEALETAKSEVLAYMQGKCAPKAQLEMFGDEEVDVEVEVVTSDDDAA